MDIFCFYFSLLVVWIYGLVRVTVFLISSTTLSCLITYGYQHLLGILCTVQNCLPRETLLPIFWMWVGHTVSWRFSKVIAEYGQLPWLVFFQPSFWVYLPGTSYGITPCFSLIHSLIQDIVIEPLLWARPYTRYWEFDDDHTQCLSQWDLESSKRDKY